MAKTDTNSLNHDLISSHSLLRHFVKLSFALLQQERINTSKLAVCIETIVFLSLNTDMYSNVLNKIVPSGSILV